MILALYFVRRIGVAIGLLWLGLAALMATFQLIAELEGREFGSAALLAIFQTPRLALETLPFACTIAAAAALQRMQENRELQMMRAAGLSMSHAAMLCASAGLAFSLAALFTGEVLLSPAESLSRTVKNVPTVKGHVWLHRDGVYFYAETLLPDGGMGDISAYQPKKGSLQVVTAQSASAQDGAWTLTKGEELELHPEHISAQTFEAREWHFSMPLSGLQAITRRPREMSMGDLSDASVLKESGGMKFAAAWWKRLSLLLALPLLSACAICVIGWRRRITVAVLAATGVSGGYYFAAVMFSQLALILRVPSLAAMPLLLVGAAAFIGARRRFV